MGETKTGGGVGKNINYRANVCHKCMDGLIVFNNKKFLDYLSEICPSQLTVKKKPNHIPWQATLILAL